MKGRAMRKMMVKGRMTSEGISVIGAHKTLQKGYLKSVGGWGRSLGGGHWNLPAVT